jgi:hypothetical protein
MWMPCFHHIMEILFEASFASKFGPTSGPKEKFFARFETFFNSLMEDQLADIINEGAERIRLLAPEDDLTREFQARVKNFFTEFLASSSSFQRGDYQEFARLVMVSKEY